MTFGAAARTQGALRPGAWRLAAVLALGALAVFAIVRYYRLAGRGGAALSELSDPDFNATKYGDWLAAQHAIYSDDFAAACGFLEKAAAGPKSELVQNTKNLAMFLAGETPGSLRFGAGGGAAARLATAAMQAKQGDWNDVYKDFKNEKSQLGGMFRIWSGAATGNFAAALKFIDAYSANDSWRNFAKGAVYAAADDPKTARKFFVLVPPGFMNLGDYHLVMSFYKKHGFTAEADTLGKDWISSPGGMFMAGVDIKADWRGYDSHQKMLGAALIQSVSHTSEGGMPESSLLALRVANILGANPDSVDYYTGGYFYSAGSENYKKYWERLKTDPIYSPFVRMKIAERAGNERNQEVELKKILAENPLFMPLIIKLWRKNMQNGREREVFRMLDQALARENVPDAGRAYLLKFRAHARYVFGDLDAAERDAAAAIALAPTDAEVMRVSALIWAAKSKNLDEAYRYAISLIKAFPSDVANWNALAMTVRAKEGDAAALEILEKVGRVAENCSELFLNLGDMRARAGRSQAAAEAYRKAIAFSDDGLVVKSEVEKKLRRVK